MNGSVEKQNGDEWIGVLRREFGDYCMEESLENGRGDEWMEWSG